MSRLYGKGICNCGQPTRPEQQSCWKCHAKYMREHRRKQSQMPAMQRSKANARRVVNIYIERGNVSRGTCEVCHSPDTQPHHEDYSKPLAVRWFCREHHLQHEGKKMRKATIERYV